MRDPGAKKNAEEKLWRPADGVLIALVAIVAVAILGISLQSGKATLKQPKVEILVGNESTAFYPLSEDRTIEIGDGCVCEIRDGQVRMIEADCPDQICVHTRAIDAHGGNIVCLPRQIILRVVDGEEREVDSIAE